MTFSRHFEEGETGNRIISVGAGGLSGHNLNTFAPPKQKAAPFAARSRGQPPRRLKLSELNPK